MTSSNMAYINNCDKKPYVPPETVTVRLDTSLQLMWSAPDAEDGPNIPEAKQNIGWEDFGDDLEEDGDNGWEWEW